MAQNNLTPEQDLLFRQMFKTVYEDTRILKTSPSHRRQFLAICLEVLNYMQLPNGNFVRAGMDISVPYGTNDFSMFPCEWEADEERANAALRDSSGPTASASSEAEDTEVREAVLSEDV